MFAPYRLLPHSSHYYSYNSALFEDSCNIYEFLSFILLPGVRTYWWNRSVLDRFCFTYVRIAATTLLAWPRIWGCVITTWIAWVNKALIAHNSWKGYWQFSYFYFACFIMWGYLISSGNSWRWLAAIPTVQLCLYGGVYRVWTNS